MASVTWQFGLGMHLFRAAEKAYSVTRSEVLRLRERRKASVHLPMHPKGAGNKSAVRRAPLRKEEFVKDFQALPFTLAKGGAVAVVKHRKGAMNSDVDIWIQKVERLATKTYPVSSVSKLSKASPDIIGGLLLPTITRACKIPVGSSKRRKWLASLKYVKTAKVFTRPTARAFIAGLKDPKMRTILSLADPWEFRPDGSVRLVKRLILEGGGRAQRVPSKNARSILTLGLDAVISVGKDRSRNPGKRGRAPGRPRGKGAVTL
jgi:hypothetical protein